MSLIDKTVWGKDAIPPTELRFRGLTRVVLPLTDLCIFLYALLSYLVAKVPALAQFAGHTYSEWWSLGLVAAAFVSLVGVSIPKLWAFELTGRLVYIGLLIEYFALYLVAVAGNLEIAANFILSLVLFWLPTWRTTDLGYVWWKRRHPEEP